MKIFISMFDLIQEQHATFTCTRQSITAKNNVTRI